MDRRQFLVSLFALPFAAKPLEALEREARMARMREFMKHRIALEVNTESMRRLSEAFLNAPTGWKKGGNDRGTN